MSNAFTENDFEKYKLVIEFSILESISANLDSFPKIRIHYENLGKVFDYFKVINQITLGLKSALF